MSFDEKRMAAPATNGDLASMAITMAVALRSVNAALFIINRDGIHPELADEQKDISEQADRLREMFNDLSGYEE